VDVFPSDTFGMQFDAPSLSHVLFDDGTPMDPKPMCLSGVRYARHLLPLAKSLVVVRQAKGFIALPEDGDGLSIAAVLAIGEAIHASELIPERTLVGFGGQWHRQEPDE